MIRDKNSAKTFVLVHRPQNDPEIHNEEASSMVFAEKPGPRKRIKTRGDLEDELGLDPSSIRDNEGEAAAYGVFYDDTDYDYMQHMRDLGGNSDGCFVEVPSRREASRKGKGKQTLEDALKETRLDDASSVADSSAVDEPPQLLDESILPSKYLKQSTYQDQQDVPDALAGFQPDMDPRLREVLEALEDEAYVDDEDEIFAELAKDREELTLKDFQESGDGYDEGQDQFEMDDGWETDDTTRPAKPKKTLPKGTDSEDVDMGGVPLHGNSSAWMNEYGKFKADTKKTRAKPAPSNSDLPSSVVTGSYMTNGRRKKRKGALTSSTSYSMTSSSLQRTEGLTLLDDRFDQVRPPYMVPPAVSHSPLFFRLTLRKTHL